MTAQSVAEKSPPADTLQYHTPETAPQFPHLRGGDVLACGFGISAAVWVSAYLCRLPFVQAPGQVTVALMIAMVLLGGFIAARFSAKGWWCALYAGAVSGIVDLLLIGAILHDYAKEHHDAAVPTALSWTLGSILLNAVAAAIGGLLGQLFPSPRRNNILWSHIFSLILVLLTLTLIGVGGLVTAFHAGLAVPDWPRSYGYNMFLFPLSLMQQNSGAFYEHSHRLLASLVGFTSLALAIHTSLAERRSWVKILPWAIGIGVAIQAVLGGTRVTETSTTLAIIHGVFAQLVFGAMAVMAAVTSRNFHTLHPRTTPAASSDRSLTLLLLFAMIIQLTLGATVRHENQGSVVLIHITMAVFVSVLVLACGFRAWGLHGNLRPLRRLGLAIMAVVLLQLILGVAALVLWKGNAKDAPIESALVTTLHQMNGALLLATTALLTTWTWRLLLPTPSSSSSLSSSSSSSLPPFPTA